MQQLAGRDIMYLKGVGSERAKVFRDELGIANFRDLAYYFPFRHADRSRFYSIQEFEGEMPEVQVAGRFVRFFTDGEGKRKVLVGIFTDGRRLMEVRWYNGISWISSHYNIATNYILFGKPVNYRGNWGMTHPEIEVYDPAKPPQGFQGVYNVSDKARGKRISSKTIAKMVETLFEVCPPSRYAETLPREVVEFYRLMPLGEAIEAMHRPKNAQQLRKARERLKFEELFYLELHILRYSRTRNVVLKGHVFHNVGKYFNDYYSRCLPFELTGAQKRVIREIRQDTLTGRQMNRLLQGDVGSGKTMVAFMSMLIAVDNGYQAALMAPTEILSQQHFQNVREWCGQLGLQARLLTGSTRKKERREILEGLMSGDVQILVGTHALIEDTVQFSNLGLAVIDEQHRFGVAQRSRMWRKGNGAAPHVLIMTATPIPRTLAMTVYGDLDVSVIDELPPGRKPISTLLHFVENRLETERLLATELRKGRQAYIVYPLIHENERLDLKSLEAGYEQICDSFRNYRVCMVHGKLKPSEKEHQMQLFASGEAQIMVATTVIEVGVNVPNATVMVIEHAERFGLSQLHQLRGRVGRGGDQSFCVLAASSRMGADTRKRMEVMTQTTDGFLVSEADMKLRGPGDMEGTQQSGLAFQLKVANLATDGQIISIARAAASAALDRFPEMVDSPADSAQTEAATDDESLRIMKRELLLRFPPSQDWSLIS